MIWSRVERGGQEVLNECEYESVSKAVFLKLVTSETYRCWLLVRLLISPGVQELVDGLSDANILCSNAPARTFLCVFPVVTLNWVEMTR